MRSANFYCDSRRSTFHWRAGHRDHLGHRPVWSADGGTRSVTLALDACAHRRVGRRGCWSAGAQISGPATAQFRQGRSNFQDSVFLGSVSRAEGGSSPMIPDVRMTQCAFMTAKLSRLSTARFRLNRGQQSWREAVRAALSNETRSIPCPTVS
jgi:hypothetical protein